MDRSSNPIDRIGQSELRRRWLLMFIAGLIAVVLQAIEHHLAKSGIDPGFMREALIQGVIFPLAFGILLGQFAHKRSKAPTLQAATIKAERHRIARDLHDSLGQNLGYVRPS